MISCLFNCCSSVMKIINACLFDTVYEGWSNINNILGIWYLYYCWNIQVFFKVKNFNWRSLIAYCFIKNTPPFKLAFTGQHNKYHIKLLHMNKFLYATSKAFLRYTCATSSTETTIFRQKYPNNDVIFRLTSQTRIKTSAYAIYRTCVWLSNLNCGFVDIEIFREIFDNASY